MLVNLRKFVNEFLDEWPILFMGNEEAHEWLMERRGTGNSTKATNILCNSEKTQRRLLENIADEPLVSTGSGTDTDGLFETIWGFEDIKALFRRAISSQKQIHILLVGPPACAKSLFMEHLMKLDNSLFTLGSHTTKSGTIDALF